MAHIMHNPCCHLLSSFSRHSTRRDNTIIAECCDMSIGFMKAAVHSRLGSSVIHSRRLGSRHLPVAWALYWASGPFLKHYNHPLFPCQPRGGLCVQSDMLFGAMEDIVVHWTLLAFGHPAATSSRSPTPSFYHIHLSTKTPHRDPERVSSNSPPPRVSPRCRVYSHGYVNVSLVDSHPTMTFEDQ
jgi:hypothetical protein